MFWGQIDRFVEQNRPFHFSLTDFSNILIKRLVLNIPCDKAFALSRTLECDDNLLMECWGTYIACRPR